MTSIYDQHDAAFANVSAFVILKGAERVATVAIKFPKDGAGRLYAYVHWIGTEMVRGMAGGYGYDKRTAAVSNAAEKLDVPVEHKSAHADFAVSLRDPDGRDWTRKLEDAGFTVLQAV